MHSLLMLAAVIAVIAIACGSETSDSRVVTTRQAARFDGILVEVDGCLRTAQPGRLDMPGSVLVWQKDVFEVTRSGDQLTIVDLFGDNGQPKESEIWRIGGAVLGSGGELRIPGVIEHAGEEFLERCAGRWWLVSGVTPA